mmetsp:Transcript_13428/g.28483  ORF Transcript_13428/g.28483 Transcript_13428/m.28483 type:complete len:100 (-) Transcript_13428:70-369(-)
MLTMLWMVKMSPILTEIAELVQLVHMIPLHLQVTSMRRRWMKSFAVLTSKAGETFSPQPGATIMSEKLAFELYNINVSIFSWVHLVSLSLTALITTPFE